MLVARRRRLSLMQRTSVPVQHSDTLIATHGGGSAPTEFVVLNTSVGARTTTGADQVIQSQSTTAEAVQVGSITKYINLFIETTPRPSSADADAGKIGFLEWAFVCVKETETTLPITQLGTKTLGDVATKMYRNECVLTGFFPVGLNQSNGTSIKIKIPSTKSRIRIGDEWRLYVYFRDSVVTSATTDSVRSTLSTIFKNYS